jgi:nucleoid-associated protein EbfC
MQAIENKIKKEIKLLDEKIFEHTSSGGAIVLKTYGNLKVESISIDEDLLDKDSKEILEQSIKMAFNEIIEKIENEKKSINDKYNSGMPNIK